MNGTINAPTPQTAAQGALWHSLEESIPVTGAGSFDKFSDRILDAPNPYDGLTGDFSRPDLQSLIQSSSLLAVRPDLATSDRAEAIAFDEYAHYVSQTYYFEVLGFQIISDLALHADEIGMFHGFVAQAMDEVRHVQAYYRLRNSLPFVAPLASCIPRLHQNIVLRGTLEEKVIKGLVVLEALAIGLFSARTRLYRNSPTFRMDQQALREEQEHHAEAVTITGEFVKSGRLRFREVMDIFREASRELTLDLLPVGIAEKHGVDLGPEELTKLRGTGLIGVQSSVTMAAFRQSLRAIQQYERESA